MNGVREALQSPQRFAIAAALVGLFGAAAAAWYQPNQLIFARTHRDWDLIDDALPHHQTYRDEGAMM